MKILFVTPSYKPAYVYGGPIVVIGLLAEELVKLGHSVTVFTTTANGGSELTVATSQPVEVDGVTVYYFRRNTGDHTHVSFDLWKALSKDVMQYDAVHLHSWWNILIIGAAWICRKKGVLPVLSPHGMFSNYILETNNSGKKKWLHQLAGKKLLASTKLHVSTQMEWEESQRIIPGWQGAIIPNLVVLPRKKYERKKNEVFTIGFLSRIDPKKGLDVLISALSSVDFSYKLLVAGSGDEEYLLSLQQLAKKKGNDNLIEWVGWKKGEEKFEFMSGLDLFALTSHSENFAIVVIEALATGTPVLVSDQVGLANYVSENDLGWVSPVDSERVRDTLQHIYSNESKRKTISHDSPAVIENDFAYSILAKQYIDLYGKNNS